MSAGAWAGGAGGGLLEDPLFGSTGVADVSVLTCVVFGDSGGEGESTRERLRSWRFADFARSASISFVLDASILLSSRSTHLVWRAWRSCRRRSADFCWRRGLGVLGEVRCAVGQVGVFGVVSHCAPRVGVRVFDTKKGRTEARAAPPASPRGLWGFWGRAAARAAPPAYPGGFWLVRWLLFGGVVWVYLVVLVWGGVRVVFVFLWRLGWVMV